MITSNLYMRVVRLQTDDGMGSAFTVDHEGVQYLITAKHVLPDRLGPVEVMLDGLPEGWRRDVLFDPMPGMQTGADIAVTRLPEPITSQHPVDASMNSMAYGQDCYFLGYPYGLGLGGSAAPQLAFVKKAILSASDDLSGPHILYLDGHNNPGFSGGPVVFYRNGDINQPSIAGVVSAYRIERQSIEVNGSVVPGPVVQANSGIIHATNIIHAMDVIRRSPS